MRLVSFRGSNGDARSGAVIGQDGDERVVDLAAASGGRIGSGDLLTLLVAGQAALEEAASLAGSLAESSAGAVPLRSVELLAPIPRPGKILALAGNYQEHIAEGGGALVDKSVIVPKLFIKPATSVLAPGKALTLPTISSTVDWELELGAVIGRTARHVPVERALDYVGGYTIVNDVSGRTADWGIEGRNPTEWDGFFDWLNGKWPDGFCPMGPWLVTPDEIPDPQDVRLRLSVNGTVYQDGSSSDMIFTVAETIAFASRFMTLEPGDVFSTGTLSGVGDATGTYLKPGDVMEGWIDRIGTLVTPVEAHEEVDRVVAATGAASG